MLDVTFDETRPPAPSLAAGTVERAVEGVAPRPWGIGTTRDGKTLYVAGGPSNDLVIVDAPTGVVVKRVPVGASPWGVVVAEQDSR